MDFVKFLFGKVNPNGRFTKPARLQFTDYVKEAVNQFVHERVADRLKSALNQEDQFSDEQKVEAEAPNSPSSAVGTPPPEDGIITTDDELEGYRVLKAILCNTVPLNRLTWRDAKSYFSVLLDDNNRRPVCRLRFNSSQKYLVLLDENRNEKRIPIKGMDDLYGYSNELKESALRYIKKPLTS